jgi:hypothetical protein
MSLEIVQMMDPNMLEMSAMCHDRECHVSSEECHTSQLMDATCLWLFRVQEFLNEKYGYLPEGQTLEVISQFLSLINPRLSCV